MISNFSGVDGPHILGPDCPILLGRKMAPYTQMVSYQTGNRVKIDLV